MSAGRPIRDAMILDVDADRRCDAMTEPDTVTAWRGWEMWPEDGILRSPSAFLFVARPQARTGSPDASLDVLPLFHDRRSLPAWHRGEYAARCRKAPHPVPAADCGCGVHGVGDVRELLGYMSFFANSGASASSGRLLWSGWSDESHVIGRVELSGRRQGMTRKGDLSSTVRGERGRVVGRVYVPRLLWGGLPAFERLHPWVTAIRIESLREIPDLERVGGEN